MQHVLGRIRKESTTGVVLFTRQTKLIKKKLAASMS
jgi:hypothetical protein